MHDIAAAYYATYGIRPPLSSPQSPDGPSSSMAGTPSIDERVNSHGIGPPPALSTPTSANTMSSIVHSTPQTAQTGLQQQQQAQKNYTTYFQDNHPQEHYHSGPPPPLLRTASSGGGPMIITPEDEMFSNVGGRSMGTFTQASSVSHLQTHNHSLHAKSQSQSPGPSLPGLEKRITAGSAGPNSEGDALSDGVSQQTQAQGGLHQWSSTGTPQDGTSVGNVQQEIPTQQSMTRATVSNASLMSANMNVTGALPGRYSLDAKMPNQAGAISAGSILDDRAVSFNLGVMTHMATSQPPQGGVRASPGPVMIVETDEMSEVSSPETALSGLNAPPMPVLNVGTKQAHPAVVTHSVDYRGFDNNNTSSLQSHQLDQSKPGTRKDYFEGVFATQQQPHIQQQQQQQQVQEHPNQRHNLPPINGGPQHPVFNIPFENISQPASAVPFQLNRQQTLDRSRQDSVHHSPLQSARMIVPEDGPTVSHQQDVPNPSGETNGDGANGMVTDATPEAWSRWYVFFFSRLAPGGSGYLSYEWPLISSWRLQESCIVSIPCAWSFSTVKGSRNVDGGFNQFEEKYHASEPESATTPSSATAVTTTTAAATTTTTATTTCARGPKSSRGRHNALIREPLPSPWDSATHSKQKRVKRTIFSSLPFRLV